MLGLKTGSGVQLEPSKNGDWGKRCSRSLGQLCLQQVFTLNFFVVILKYLK
jgi:hypothetical protein